MTRVAYLHGIPRQTALNEASDRSRQVRSDAPNFAVLGNNKAAGALLLRQTQLLAEYYRDRPEVQQAYTYVRDALATGKTRTTGRSDIERQVANEVSKLRLKRPKLRGNEDARERLFEAMLDGSANSDLVMSLCSGHRFLSNRWAQCVGELRLIAEAGQHLQKVGYHMLYEFASPRAAESAVVTKRILHKNGVGSLANITKLSRENMSRWVRVSVMESNVRAQLPPLQPEDSITELREGLLSGVGIGVVPVPAVAIIGAIASALAAAAGVIAALRSDAALLRNNAQGFGMTSYGPERTDFPAGPGLPPGDNPLAGGSMLPLLLGGAGILLLTQNNK